MDSRMDTASEEALRPWPWWDDAAATIGASTTWSIDRRIVYRRPTANERCGYKNGGKKDTAKDMAGRRERYGGKNEILILTNFLVNTAFYKKIWWKQWMETIAITME